MDAGEAITNGLVKPAPELTADDRALLVRRNVKHRNEMTERLERLLQAIKGIEAGASS